VGLALGESAQAWQRSLGGFALAAAAMQEPELKNLPAFGHDLRVVDADRTEVTSESVESKRFPIVALDAHNLCCRPI
jgi:hypothetical protein